METDDFELLHAYQRDRDESAFARLVDRHGGWIFATARRRLGSDHLAEDATQAVFVVLADKAGQLVTSGRGSLAAWLFHVVHFTSARIRRSESRQVERDLAAAADRARTGKDKGGADPELLQLLDDSIAQLAPIEREMVVGRFYRRQRFADIGAALGISAEAARKRVTRSLDEIKALMLRAGVAAISDALITDFTHPPKRLRAAEPASRRRIKSILKETVAMADQPAPSQGGHQMISAEFLVRDVEANLEFFEKLGFPRRFIDKPDTDGRIPRASLTAGALGKIWIRRAGDEYIRPSSSINIFFWIDGGPDGLIAHRSKIAASGVQVTPIIDEYRLPNFNVTTPDGYSIAFFTQYVPPGSPPTVLVK